MKIESLFERDVNRPINGVVKADQLDDSAVWQELDEFVVTREIEGHLRRFFSDYVDAIRNLNDPDVAGKIGVWVSGFFGSGKSHLIKVLSYLLRNRAIGHNGQSKKAIDFFETKIKDATLLGDIKRAVVSDTDVILFNIDSKADQRSGRDALLAVFLRVLNELQGYSGDYAHIAHLERYLDSKGKLKQFQDAFRQATGSEWKTERDAYQFHRDEVIEALTQTLNLSQESAEKWVDGAENSFALTVENFCKWVKEYLDTRGPDHRLIFLVDEVGQFIGTESYLMLNLQTITEELGTICKGRAWVVVTSQEDIDAVIGEMRQSKANDFSKIQGRFRTRLSLSSANVDEVIQSRLLAKRPEAVPELEELFKQKGDIVKNQLTFDDCGMTMRNYKDVDDFVKNYPFAPYQFQLVQKIFEMIRRVGASGLHLSRGERSALDAFQSAVKQVALQDTGRLVPLYRFYPSIESFLDTAVKRTIDQAEDNTTLEPFDISLLQALFLVRYVEEVKSNVNNLVTLCIDEIDADRVALRSKIEASLQRLEKETLISRNGDIYQFLTNEERDISREIKNLLINPGEEAKLLGELIFTDVLKEQRKYRYPLNKMDFDFNRRCDLHPVGNQFEGALLVSVVTPLNGDYDAYKESAKCILESTADGGNILIRLGNEESLGREIRTYLQTENYVRHKNDGTLTEATRKILRSIADDNQTRRTRLVKLLGEMAAEADYFVNGQSLKLKATAPMAALNEAMEYLIKNSFTKMGYLKRLTSEADRTKEMQSILRSNDIGQQTLLLQTEDGNKQAIEDVRDYVALCASQNKQVILHDMIQKRYALRPYGWPDEEVLILIARLMVLGEISLIMDGALIPIDKAYEAITTAARRRKVIVTKRQTTDPKALQDARTLGKALFSEMGPDGEDALYDFLRKQLTAWQTSLNGYRPLAETGDYPGKDEIADGLLLIRKLISFDSSYKFIEQFNSSKNELLGLADNFRDLENFYTHQRPSWEKLRKEYRKFQLNQMELERHDKAGPALKRMAEILKAPAPYGLIKEADGLINTVGTVNGALLAERRKHAQDKIGGYIATLTQDIETAGGDERLRNACLNPLESLRSRVQTEDSLAHITEAESEALKEFDLGLRRIEEFVQARKPFEPGEGPPAPKPPIKRHRVVEPAKLVKSAYLETTEDVRNFLDELGRQLQEAIGNNERVQIR